MLFLWYINLMLNCLIIEHLLKGSYAAMRRDIFSFDNTLALVALQLHFKALVKMSALVCKEFIWCDQGSAVLWTGCFLFNALTCMAINILPKSHFLLAVFISANHRSFLQELPHHLLLLHRVVFSGFTVIIGASLSIFLLLLPQASQTESPIASRAKFTFDHQAMAEFAKKVIIKASFIFRFELQFMLMYICFTDLKGFLEKKEVCIQSII